MITEAELYKKGLLRDKESSPFAVYLAQLQYSGDLQIFVPDLRSKRTNFTSIELFAGCGGSALGLENAGFNHKLILEKDQDAMNTIRANRLSWPNVCVDIRDMDFTPYRGEIDLVSGGFPCQSFSQAGKRKGLSDDRGSLYKEFARCVQQVKPKIFLFENVLGLVQHNKGETLKTILSQFPGYRIEYRVLHAQFHDVPQKRDRVFVIGVWDDSPIKFPEPKNYTIPIRSALNECPSSVGFKYSPAREAVLRLVPEGGYWCDLPLDVAKEYMRKSFYLPGGKTGMARRLSRNEPSLTLMCSPSQLQTERCHPTETRPLTVREYARIQTFPDHWAFAGSITSQYRQIGNAVPVNLAYHVGRSLIGMLEAMNEVH